MEIKCSKKLLQNKITKEKDVKIRTKDLSNIHRKNKELKTNDLQVVEKILKRKGNAFNVYFFSEYFLIAH